ncbi:hypothetical protein BgiMline_026719, partial [Biomphalaria glabrata]
GISVISWIQAMMMGLRMIVTLLLLGLSQPIHCAVMRLDYGVVGYYFDIEFTQGMFEKILTHLSDPRANVVTMDGADKKGLTFTVQSVGIEYSHEPTSNAETPKYICEYYSKDRSFKCRRIQVLMTCPASQNTDLFGLKLKPGEFFNDTSLSSTTRTCKGESDSVWSITFYKKIEEKRDPIDFNSDNALEEQRMFRTTPGLNYDDTLSDFTGVETSSLKNVHTTESKEVASDASVAVIVASIVVALIVITGASVLIYCLVCRRRQRRSSNLNPSGKTIPRYEEVRFLPDNEMPHPGSNTNGNHVNFSVVNCGRPHPGRINDGNFSGISNIYSYPFPYSVKKKQDKKPNGDIPNDPSLSDYSNPVDSYYDPRQINSNSGDKYTELESSSLSSKRAFWKRKKSDYAPETSEYSNPDDSYHVPRSLHDSEISSSNNYSNKYTELESTTYSMNDQELPYKLSNTPPVYSDPKVGAPEKNKKKDTLSIHEYNKLGEETKELMHEYDYLEDNSK